MEEFVPVMVPKAFVTDIYVHLGKLVEGTSDWPEPEPDRPTGAASQRGIAPLDDRTREWDADLVRRSWAESPRSMLLVLRHLAEASDQWIPIDELARVAYPDTGSRPQLAGALGAWGHRCSSRYEATTWPFETRWNHATQMYEYRMARHFAELYRPHFD